MVTKQQIIELVELAYAAECHLAGLLSADERETAGQPDNWNARDTLVHGAEWQRRAAGEIAGGRRGQKPPEKAGDDSENAAIFAQYRAVPWRDVQALIDTARAATIQQIQELSEAELNDPKPFPWADQPVWRIICGDILHINAHLWPLIIAQGDRAYAAELGAREAELSARLDSAPAWQGLVHYNLACRQALSGETERALENLALALHERPNLKDWSQQDTDLASLHEDARYKELLEKV